MIMEHLHAIEYLSLPYDARRELCYLGLIYVFPTEAGHFLFM